MTRMMNKNRKKKKNLIIFNSCKLFLKSYHMYVCIYCVCVRMCVRVYVYICVGVCLYVCVHVCISCFVLNAIMFSFQNYDQLKVFFSKLRANFFLLVEKQIRDLDRDVHQEMGITKP